MSGRKQEEYTLPVYLFRKFKVKVKVKGCSSGFLPDSCNRNAGISVSLQTKTRISILVQSFDSGSAQPLQICSHISQIQYITVNYIKKREKGRLRYQQQFIKLVLAFTFTFFFTEKSQTSK